VAFPRFLRILRVSRIPPPGDPGIPRDPVLIGIETLVRQAIRDAVNRSSRKPFAWGGLSGYEQLEAVVQELDQIQKPGPESAYLRLLRTRVERVLSKNRTVAEDLKSAHQILLQVAQCLRYPPSAPGLGVEKVSSRGVAQEMTKLIQEIKPGGRVQRAQIRLLGALKRRWELFGQELLHCYDIPGLPQDNLQMEALFGRLRRHQRRISGRKSTRELLDFGQAQVLFTAKTFQDLVDQIQLVPRETYLVHRSRLADAELPRQFFHRLHHDPAATFSALLHDYTARIQDLEKYKASVLLKEQTLHTD
jgi:hypothetical protein